MTRETGALGETTPFVISAELPAAHPTREDEEEATERGEQKKLELVTEEEIEKRR